MKFSISIPARLSELSSVRTAVNDFIGDGLDEISRGRLVLAIDEAVSNVISHGYLFDESKTVDIEMDSTEDSFRFVISDTAIEYNPAEYPCPDIDLYHEEGRATGLGVDAYSRIMKVSYERRLNGGNRLILVKEKKNETT